jgi:hypothetical protein
MTNWESYDLGNGLIIYFCSIRCLLEFVGRRCKCGECKEETHEESDDEITIEEVNEESDDEVVGSLHCEYEEYNFDY